MKYSDGTSESYPRDLAGLSLRPPGKGNCRRLGVTPGNISSRLSKLAAYGIIKNTRGRIAHNSSACAIYNAPTSAPSTKAPSFMAASPGAAKPSKISDLNFTVTGVPIERRFALLVLFVGDIPHELAIVEGCRRNPQADTASRRRETVDRALQVFSLAILCDVTGQRFPIPALSCRSCRPKPRLPNSSACRSRALPKSIRRSAAATGGSTSEFPVPPQPVHSDMCASDCLPLCKVIRVRNRVTFDFPSK